MFFFFQAEDGIRDLTVTGVQTCALPIYSIPEGSQLVVDTPGVLTNDADFDGNPRSEEHTSELQSQSNLVCRLLLEKKNSWGAENIAQSGRLGSGRRGSYSASPRRAECVA